jgi:hypothetical protein
LREFVISDIYIKLIGMTANELYEEIKRFWTVYEENHIRFHNKQVKAAGSRARKALLEIKHLTSKYRTACLAESKEIDK